MRWLERRAMLYGGDHTPGRDPELLDPTGDAARVRAMYTTLRMRAVALDR